MDTRFGLTAEQVAQFCRENHIRRLSLFGSVLRDDFGPGSDIDVLVEFEPNTQMGLMGLTRVELALGELVGRRVDLVTPAGLHRRSRQKVVSEAQVLYAS
jgi:uncharacterized protein